MLSKVLVHDDIDNNIHYVFGNFLNAEATICGKHLNSISTTHISNAKIPVTCEECRRRSNQDKSIEDNILEALVQLKLHETMFIDDETSVLRVPHGWLYTTIIKTADPEGRQQISNRTVSTTFVPEES